jgi:hypothetical protein
MRVYAHGKRPTPGAQLTQFEAEEGWLQPVGHLPARAHLHPARLAAAARPRRRLAEAEPKRCATTSSTAQISAAWPWQLRS